MLILSVESSAKAVSAALLEDDRIIGEFFIHTKQTHSETLMPMVEHLLSVAKKDIREVDVFAVAAGPGSFTGVRIGVSCVKGMAFPYGTPCCGIPTLEAIAYNGLSFEGQTICAVMDARCGQVYNAVFRVENGMPVRLTEDRALSIDALSEELRTSSRDIILMGDGAELCHKTFHNWGCRIAAEHLRFQRAASVAAAAKKFVDKKKTVHPKELVPLYLRIPQAERELKKRNGGEV